MSTVSLQTDAAEERPPEPRVHYLNVNYGVRSWLLSTDHKRIAILYLVTITLMFFIGGAAITVVRLHLLTPEGALVNRDTYNSLFTMHGIVMVFFFLIPAIPATIGNFCLPIMIGAKDLAFPRLNLLSWYVFVVGALFTLWSILAGGVDTGWTFYTPYSSTYAHSNVMAAALGAFISGFSSILTGLNFIVTIHQMRAPGMTWFRLPLFIWAHYATSIIILLGTPVVAMTILLVGIERVLHIGIFDPALGGDPLLFQHLFWFYSHPAVYIMILPGMGVVSEIITCFSRSYLVAIPSAIKVFNWTATLYKGSISFQTPMLYALGFIGLFTIGGLTGLFLAAAGLDVHVHDTYFIIAHFHFIMVGGMVMAYLGALHYWWPKMSGRMYPDGWGRASALIIFVGFIFTFMPQFVVGYQGMVRRSHHYDSQFQVLNVMSSAGASILAIGYVLPLGYLLWSLGYGKKAGPNPWQAKGLEWQTLSPPPPDNFAATPTVTEEPYNYSGEPGHGH